VVAALAALASGCTLTAPGYPPPAGSGPLPGTTADGGAANTTPTRGSDVSSASGAQASVGATGAAAALLDRSRTERATGDLAAAAATIERALAIAPDDAALWVELAEIRWDQGQTGLAGETARKALTLTPSNSPLARRAERLIGR